MFRLKVIWVPAAFDADRSRDFDTVTETVRAQIVVGGIEQGLLFGEFPVRAGRIYDVELRPGPAFARWASAKPQLAENRQIMFHTTMWQQTWIFLDDEERAESYWLNSQ